MVVTTKTEDVHISIRVNGIDYTDYSDTRVR